MVGGRRERNEGRRVGDWRTENGIRPRDIGRLRDSLSGVLSQIERLFTHPTETKEISERVKIFKINPP